MALPVRFDRFIAASPERIVKLWNSSKHAQGKQRLLEKVVAPILAGAVKTSDFNSSARIEFIKAVDLFSALSSERNDLLSALGISDPDKSTDVIKTLIKQKRYYEEAREPVAEILFVRGFCPQSIDIEGVIEYFIKLDCSYADQVIAAYLLNQITKKSPGFYDLIYHLKDAIKKHDLINSKNALMKIRHYQKTKAQTRKMLLSVARNIVVKICRRLSIDLDMEVTTSRGSYGYIGRVSIKEDATFGSVLPMASTFASGRFAGPRLEQLQLPTLQMRLMKKISNELNIEEGTSLKDMKRRVRTLNFLVHHEIGHLVQLMQKIAKPKVEIYLSLDNKLVKRNANEVLIDKLGFELARKVYVYQDLNNQKTSAEELAINSYLAISKVVLNNKKDYPFALYARMIAVIFEMAGSQYISESMRSDLLQSAGALYVKLANCLDIDEQNEQKYAEIAKLINDYRSIFRQTTLGEIGQADLA